jgi:uncharacterized protein (TIGR00730 family)
MKRVAVFCGSSAGSKREYAAATVQLAKACVRRGIGLVYGGASVGLMRALAIAAAAEGGEIIGVIPRFLIEMEGAQPGLAELRIVRSMHERKALMAELSDGFIALPGGLGTLEEFFEILTWAQLGLHAKPCGILNVDGYYDGLLNFLEHASSQEFIKPKHRQLILVGEEPENLLREMQARESRRVAYKTNGAAALSPDRLMKVAQISSLRSAQGRTAREETPFRSKDRKP